MLTPLLCALVCSPTPQDSDPYGEVPYEPGLTLLERAAGWKTLAPSAWESWNSGEAWPAGWSPSGAHGLRLDPQPNTPNVGLRSVPKFERVEFAFEAFLGPASNSGIKLRVSPEGGPLGPEYQLLDDFGNGEARTAKRSLGALYDVYAPEWKELSRGPQWISGLILDEGHRLQFWLNSFRTVDAFPGSQGWAAAIADSKFKNNERYAAVPEGGGHIVLQHHGDSAAFERLRYREVPEPVQLVTPGDLSAWTELGDADWSFNDEGHLVGKVGGGGQSFLMTKKPYGDFTLRARFKPVQPGNSGLQIRSHLSDAGRLFGYQIEIDSSERAWSGGLYDEARRGWIHNLAGDNRAREAFRPGDWNEYVVECVGPTIRTWVNGVPAADVIDPLDLEGHIALQVHSGNDTEVVWSSIEIWERGQADWQPFDWLEATTSWTMRGPILSKADRQADLDSYHALGMGMWVSAPAQPGHPVLGDLAVASNSEGSLVISVDDWAALPTLVIPNCRPDGEVGGALRSIGLAGNWTENAAVNPWVEASLGGPAVALLPESLQALVQTRSQRSKHAVGQSKNEHDELVITRFGDRLTVHVNGWALVALKCARPTPWPTDALDTPELNGEQSSDQVVELNGATRFLTWYSQQ